jgi:hypothetical protein
MSHVIGQPENQQSNEGSIYSTIVTNTATPIEIKRFPIKIGEGGGIEIKYNAITGESPTPRQVNRYRVHGFKRADDGTISLPTPIPLVSRHDTGGASIDYVLEVDGDAIVMKVTGAAGIEIRHTALTQKVSGVLHESFTI